MTGWALAFTIVGTAWALVTVLLIIALLMLYYADGDS